MEDIKAKLTSIEAKLAGHCAESKLRWEEAYKDIKQIKLDILDLKGSAKIMEAHTIAGLKEDMYQLKKDVDELRHIIRLLQVNLS
jgi:hypothetical protein